MLLLCPPIVSAELSPPALLPHAPFTNDVEILRFSEHLMTSLGETKLDAAVALARRNSHLDDKTTQQNLTETFESLHKHLNRGELNHSQLSHRQFDTRQFNPGQFNNGHGFEIRYIQRSAFGRSFIRHQYELQNDMQKLRCMITYRRKTDGWRLNQLWCS